MDKSKSEIIKIDPTEEKEIIFWPDNLTEEIKSDWPIEMRKEGGFQLGRVQQGFEPNNYRLMPIIGLGLRKSNCRMKEKINIVWCISLNSKRQFMFSM